MSFAAGQSWAYRAPAGFETSRIAIGAIVHFEDRESVICFSVFGAPRAAGADDTVVIPFIPMAESAFAATVTALDEHEAELPEAFAQQLQGWSNDDRGLAVLTVPFQGYVNQMMTSLMSSLVSQAQPQHAAGGDQTAAAQS